MENVTVKDLFSSMPNIGTFLIPFFSIVFGDTSMYFDGVWSKSPLREEFDVSQPDSQFCAWISTLLLFDQLQVL